MRDPGDPDVVDPLARDQLHGGVEDSCPGAGPRGRSARFHGLDPTGMTPGERAKAFVDEILIPREVDAELGRLTADDVALIRREALARGISGGLHAREHGGQGWTHVEWFVVEEQFGRSTNALSWHVPTAYNVLAHGSPEQIER